MSILNVYPKPLSILEIVSKDGALFCRVIYDIDSNTEVVYPEILKHLFGYILCYSCSSHIYQDFV